VPRDDHGREARTNRENARAMTWLLAVNDTALPERDDLGASRPLQITL
jgi:hypothetical protein